MNQLMEYKLGQYDSGIDNFRKLQTCVTDILSKAFSNASFKPMQIISRIKTRDSVAEKLLRKPDKYSTVSEMTDLLGFRIICYFSDEVDICASQIEKILDIDRNFSTDKRKLIEPNAFGYLSLHYICSLPSDSDYPQELKALKFEIQIRSVLQHTWAEIEHDLGYKTEFGVPREIRREFARIAGLLEIADEGFLNIRKHIIEYEEKVRQNITNDTADNMNLDKVTLIEYIKLSKTMKSLLSDIAAVSNAKIQFANPEYYILKLDFF